MWSVLAVAFALFGISQIRDGRAAGTHGVFPVDRYAEPALFWIYTAAYFVIAAWILVVVAKSDSSTK